VHEEILTPSGTITSLVTHTYDKVDNLTSVADDGGLTQ
jgi:hypothetical protein